MSAIPKKKLCWNCEGNVSKEIDNCPYCGVYLHAAEQEENHSIWNPSYQSTHLAEEESEENEEEEDMPMASESPSINIFSLFQASPKIKQSIKTDVLSVLFLMAGSIFLLFGTLLFLFADEQGYFTLRWQADQWIYFLSLAFPLLYFGWRFWQQLHPNEEL